MAEIDVEINGRSYRIACDDGQESHLTELARYVDQKVSELVTTVGQVGDARLLVMASLLLADELADAYAALDDAQEVKDGVEGAARSAAEAAETRAAQAIAALAARIEGIAARLEAA
jgi:cell division protein ZapA